MSNDSYIQLPSDSVGKKLFTKEHVVGANTVQGQVIHLADNGNPSHIQVIDHRGSASVRFSEGSPLSDAFGNLKVSAKTTIGTYDFVGNPSDSLYSDVIVGTGAITHIPNASTMSLSVGSASGDFASRTTNKYHFYLPGTGNLTIMTVALSDSFMDGCERRWGIFDVNNGAYFHLDDLGNLKVSVRSNVSGSVVNNSVDRTLWNEDKLDGTGSSGFILDVTKLNIYWVDYQWLGAGRVRFGVIDDRGDRIVAHTMLHAGHNIYPYMKSGSLPIQVNIENKRITGGAASIRLTCASVQSEGAADYTFWNFTGDFTTKSITGSNHHLLSLKAKSLYNGIHNVTNAYPETFNCYVATGTIKVDIYWDQMTLVGSTFAQDVDSTVLVDQAGTVTIAGTEYKVRTLFLDAGVHNIDLSSIFNKLDEGIIARADETQPEYVTFVATKIAGTPTIEGSVSYAEVR